MKTKYLSIFSLLVLLTSCIPSIVSLDTQSINNFPLLSKNDYEYRFIGERVEFIKTYQRMVSTYYQKSDQWWDSGGRSMSYNELLGKQGVLNWIKTNGLYRWYMITLDDGRQLYNKRFVSKISTEMNNVSGYIEKVYVLSEFEELKNKYLNKSIWLNKTQFISNLFPDPVFGSQDLFQKWEEVIVKEIIPYDGNGYPPFYYFRLESKDGTKGCFIQVSQPREQVNNYFDEYPFDSSWSEDIVETIKSNKIKLGMTKQQVILSWGNPNDINRTMTQYSISEQWVYSKGNYENYYLYFDDEVLKSFQD